MDKFQQLTALVDATEADAAKFYEQGNQAAGTRVRKAMLQLRNLANDIRSEVQAIKNARK